MYVSTSKSLRGHIVKHILYLSILKPGSNTHRGSNIHRVVQQNEWNKRLGPFKCRVPKLLNLSLKWCQTLKEINYSQHLSWCLHSPFGCCYSQSFIAYLSRLLPFRTGMHLRVLLYQSVSEVYTLINALASNHTIKLINTGTSTCHSTLDRWTKEN